MASYLEALTTLEEKLAAVEKAVDERDRAATAHAQQIGARLDTLLDGITSTTPSGDGPSKANTENTLSSSLPSWTSSPSHDPRGIL